jgi:hypothetical protein
MTMVEHSNIHHFTEWAKARLDEMEATVATLEIKTGELQQDARSTAEAALSDMRARRDAFKMFVDQNRDKNEAAWKSGIAKLESDWDAFESDVEQHVKATKDSAEQYQSAFHARADAQIKAWQATADRIRNEATQFGTDQKAKVEDALDHLKQDAETQKAKLEGLKAASGQTWSALNNALSESRAAFDRANQQAHKAFESALN